MATPTTTPTTLPPSLEKAIALIAGNGAAGITGTTAQGIVSGTDAALEVPLATTAHGWLIPSTKGSNANGYYTATLGDLLTAFINTGVNGGKKGREIVAQIQSDLKASGQLAGKYAPGVINGATLTAFKDVALAASGGSTGSAPVPLMKLLNAAGGMTGLVTENSALSSAIQSETTSAMGATVATQSLDDPNYIKQQFGAAMESMGMGAPTPQQADQFVQAFLYGPQGQLAARQDQVATQKADLWSGINRLKSDQRQLDSGALTPQQAAQQAAQPGPSFVATKSEPNLDAEAMASAKSIDPGQYYATGASYLGGLLNQMVQGAPTFQTRSEAPSASAPAGGVVSTPLAGAP